MNIETSNDFLKEKEIKIKFAPDIHPLVYALRGDNLERYKKLSRNSKNTHLNLEVVSKSTDFNDLYITVVYDKEIDKLVVFYYVYRKYFTNFSSYKEFQMDKNWFEEIITLLKDNEADPEAISEKVIFE